jgi:hypothetical protein
MVLCRRHTSRSIASAIAELSEVALGDVSRAFCDGATERVN